MSRAASLQRQAGRPARPAGPDVPPGARALVILAHGSRHPDPRTRAVAAVLQNRQLATLLFELLADEESADRHTAHGLALHGARVEEVIDWAAQHTPLGGLPVGLFGADTGAAALLRAAAERPAQVGAIVLQGGRPDLAAPWLPRIVAPTLLIVGGADATVLSLNRQALRALGCNKRLEVVPGATHRFEEPGTLDSVAQLAAAWFATHLGARRHA